MDISHSNYWKRNKLIKFILQAKSGLNQIYVKNPEQGQIIENGQSVEEIVHEENEEYVLFMIIAFISFLAMAFTV